MQSTAREVAKNEPNVHAITVSGKPLLVGLQFNAKAPHHRQKTQITV